MFQVRRKDCKKGDLGPSLANYFLKKNWSQDHIYTMEFLKIVFSSIGSPTLQV